MNVRYACAFIGVDAGALGLIAGVELAGVVPAALMEVPVPLAAGAAFGIRGAMPEGGGATDGSGLSEASEQTSIAAAPIAAHPTAARCQ